MPINNPEDGRQVESDEATDSVEFDVLQNVQDESKRTQE